MPTWIVRKVTVELAEVEAPTREEARRLADEEGYGTFNLSETRFTAHRPTRYENGRQDRA